MKLLQKIFSKTVYIDPKTVGRENLHVEEINPGDQSITGALGITHDRAADLEGMCVAAYRKSNNIATAAVVVSRECVHANELFFATRLLCFLHDGHHHQPVIRVIPPSSEEGS